MTVVWRSSRRGLRRVRVGEASNPGSQLSRHGSPSQATAEDAHLVPSRASAELLDAMQEDLEDTEIRRRTRRRVVPSGEDLALTQKAARCLHQKFYDEECWPRLSNPERALMRSQCGPLASITFTAVPTSRMTRIEAQPFRLQAEAQVCREAGTRVRTNTFVRDMDLEGVHVLDGRRLEVVADGLTLWHGAQLAIDTTLVSPPAPGWHRQEDSGRPQRGGTATSQTHQGDHLPRALRRKRKGTFGAHCRSRIAMVRGDGTIHARSGQPLILQNRVKAAWLRRWSSVLACSAARAFAWSLLDKPANPGTGADTPVVHEVLRDDKFA